MSISGIGAEPAVRPHWLTVRFKALHAFSLPVSALPVVMATAVVLPVGQWNWPILVASVLGAALLQCAGNVLNDYFDYKSGVDRKVEGDENRPGRQLVKGFMTPRQVLIQGLACMFLGLAAAAYVLVLRPELLWFALAGCAALYIYTGPPLALKYRALGEPLIFLTFGPLLMLGAAFAQTGELEMRALLLSIPVGLATTSVLVGNNIRDREEDRQAGIRTLSAVLGHGGLRLLYVVLILLSVAAVAAMAAAGLLPRILLASPLLLVLAIKPIRAAVADRRQPDMDAQTAKFVTALYVAIILALSVGD